MASTKAQYTEQLADTAQAWAWTRDAVSNAGSYSPDMLTALHLTPFRTAQELAAACTKASAAAGLTGRTEVRPGACPCRTVVRWIVDTERAR